MDMNTYGSHPDRYEPVDWTSRQQTLTEKIEWTRLELESKRVSKQFWEEQAALYVVTDVPAIIELDLKWLRIGIMHLGRRLGGLNSALKRQKIQA